ncbi:hypothetical protein [Scopulibacillus darangshiensis]|uniref:hypothetical protein n=1 Tax=Scopulibacillus darangshiensis TaxID=442528 RepID=UPI001FB4ADAC|nr:hypothetical protein [Scopulibacillus darangshiensis]
MEREKRKWYQFMEGERKKRANRLIQKGALLEKYFDCEKLNVEETEELLKVFADYVNHNKPNYLK